MMYPGNWLVLALVVGLLGFYLGFLLWAYRSGQLQQTEAAKYRVFHDEPAELPEGRDEEESDRNAAV